MGLWEQITSPEFLRQGWLRVQRNGGRPGLDGVSIRDFNQKVEDELLLLADEIAEEAYYPGPLLVIELDEKRKIGIANVRDRVVQQSLYLLLNPLFEPEFLDNSYAYRPGRNALMAVDAVEKALRSGRKWVMETDIAHFFDSIPHEGLLLRLQDSLRDERLIQLILRCLKATVFSQMKIYDVEMGVTQGSALSPLLGNLYLHPLDGVMVQLGVDYFRYSDDILVLTPDRTEAEEALRILRQALKELGLTIKEEKTAIRAVGEGFTFLGYHFDRLGKGPSRKALDGLQNKLALLARHRELAAYDDRLTEVEAIVRGWEEYFGPFARIEPEDWYTYVVLLRRALERGDEPEIQRLAEMGDRLGEGDGEIRLHAARLWQRYGRKERAIEEAGRLLMDHGEVPGAVELLQKIWGGKARAAALLPLLLTALRSAQDEAWMELAQAYAEKGLFDLALAAQSQRQEHGASPQLLAEEMPEEIPEESPLPVVEEPRGEELPPVAREITGVEATRFSQLFMGREGVFAIERVDEGGRRSYYPAKGFLSKALVESHLAGRQTLGQYLIRANQTVRYVVIDIDIPKKTLLVIGDSGEVFEKWLKRAWQDGRRIQQTASVMGIPAYLEFSGYRGYHVWVFFERALPLQEGRNLALALLGRSGEPSKGIHWECFPNTTKVKSDQLGPLIKLPLGRHRTSGRFSRFLDDRGKMVEDPLAFLEAIQPLPIEKARELLAADTPETTQRALRRSLSLTQWKEEKREKGEPNTPDVFRQGGPLCQKVLQGCVLMAHMVDKAVKTGYLVHQERVSLLMVFGHLGEEGREFLHRVISYCINYNREVTERYIKKLLLPRPVSCPRLREIYPQQTASLGCDCRFRQQSGQYPSPVLHTIEGGKGKPKAVTLPLTENGEEAGEAHEVLYHEEANRLLKKLVELKRQAKAIEKCLDRYEEELDQLFRREGKDRLPVEMGTLVRDVETGKWKVEID